MSSRILKFSKPYFSWAKQISSHCFNSRAQSHNLITKTITSSLPDVTLQNRSSVQCRSVSSHAQIANHQSVTIETFDDFFEEGNVREATKAVLSLEDKDYVVDLPRLLGLAKLCGEAEALEEARVVHDCITDSNALLDVRSYHMLIEMYLDCGSTKDALNVFDEMPERNLETWCFMIMCLAKNREGELAIDMFTRFKNEGNKPNNEIFKAVFFACASLGDINEGLLHFDAMYRDYGIIPSMDHYVSVTEMLASCGHLDEALEFVERMKIEPSVEVWETLMNLCWVHGDLELGDRFAELVKKLDATRMNKESNAGLVTPKESDFVKEKHPLKKRGKSKVEFKAGDTSHPEFDSVFATLRSLKIQMLDMGFVPATRVCFDKVEKEEKEMQLLLRSNKLCAAYGILRSKPRSPVNIILNYRICIDGHNTLKMISEITGRKLIQRDSKRVHYYKNGFCSCNDYW